MTHVSIAVFKNSGKYYTSCEAEHKRNLMIFEDEWKEFVITNLPAKIEDGFVVVMDLPDGEGFHCVHYRYEELMRRYEGI